MEKNAVLVVSFGTSHLDTLNSCIEATENRIHEALPGFELRRAFTSNFIIKKLAKRDKVIIDKPQKALERLKNEGFTHVVVQPLHILPGYEYHKIKDVVMEFTRRRTFKSLLLGEPLLYNNKDYPVVVEALKTQLTLRDDETACILMGHGTDHFSNACYYCLQSFIDESGLNAYIANVEGAPSLENVLGKLKRKETKKIKLMPFMLVAGDHARNDMAGEEDSWKTILEKEGFEVEVHMHGLGEKEEFRQIFAQKALETSSNGKKLIRPMQKI
ncbi:MAG: sirohydrochlorin cobaltochelatase [Dethiobacteria bacterium]|nr:sirohydrochlorin cobaltochelatase [Bacillota bacterium]